MEILSYSMKWLELTLRWGHVLFAILWVGNSFLFNYLDNKLNKNISSRDVDAEGYLMHSGYYYKLTRLKSSPPINYLRSLVIFKWQSYLTFITGILLLAVIYYYRPEILMVDKKVLNMLPSTAIILSILSLVVSWLIYDFLCKSNLIKNEVLFIKGEKSKYIDAEKLKLSEMFFPNYKLQKIRNAGHWVHYENPNDFFLVCSDYLNN